MTNLRQRYRDYLSRLEGAVSPAETIKQGLQVPSPMDALRHELSRRAELRPEQANYLLLGNIGTGKTLQMMLIEHELQQSQGVQAVYLDVSREVGAGPVAAGRLIQAVAAGLARKVPDEEKLREMAADMVPFLTGQSPSFNLLMVNGSSEASTESSKALGQLTAFWEGLLDVDLVLLLDGLDRLDVESFRRIVEDDLNEMRGMGLGVVLVGPPRLVYEKNDLLGRFDRIYNQPVLDPATDEQSRFLFDVLRQRASAEILPDESCRFCVAWSGGLLRDLLLLAQLAGEEAYVQGSETISLRHVTEAARHLGERMERALTPSLEGLLMEAHATIGFGIPSGDGRELKWTDLMSNNLLLRRAGRAGFHYQIHPCLQLSMGIGMAAQ